MKTLRVAALALGLLALVAVPGAAQFENMGTIEFPTSATGEAQDHFLRGVTIMHLYGWAQAIEEFQAAQAIDPDFVMAYWAESLTYRRALAPRWGPAVQSREVLQRLAPTPEERLAKAPTAREKGFLAAVEVLWSEADHVDRRIGYMFAMERLHETYPDDPEVALFYSLSMLSAVSAVRSGYTPMAAEPGTPRLMGSGAEIAERLTIRAAAMAQGVLTDNPDHPGAAHYVIHALDEQLYAPMALKAAYRLSEIAPADSHARHIPTHIFTQLGMWDLVSTQSESAYDAAADLWTPGDDMGDALHSLDRGQYADLQLGDYEKARLWIRRIDMIANGGGFLEHSGRGQPGLGRAVSALDLVRTRYIVETEEWQTWLVTEDSSPNELLATALSAYNLGDQEMLAQAEAALAEFGGVRDEIMYKQASALLHAGMGHADLAIRLMDEAQTAVEALREPWGPTTNPPPLIKPVHELFGELLMDLGRPLEAIEKFEQSLVRITERPRSHLGLARAFVATGNTMMAVRPYEKVTELWAGHESLPGMLEARTFLNEH